MYCQFTDGEIYTVVNDLNDTIYVGSTTVYLPRRMMDHSKKALTGTTDFYVAMRTLGRKHFRIVSHHLFPCKSRAELVAEEMRTLDAFIKAGRSVYNSIIAGKHSSKTIAKMSAAHEARWKAKKGLKLLAEAVDEMAALVRPN